MTRGVPQLGCNINFDCDVEELCDLETHECISDPLEGWFRMQSPTHVADLCLESNAPTNLNWHNGASFMDNCQNVTGQLWRIIPTERTSEERQVYRFQSVYQGNDRCLVSNDPDDELHDGAVYMDTCLSDDAQDWVLIPQ